MERHGRRIVTIRNVLDIIVVSVQKIYIRSFEEPAHVLCQPMILERTEGRP